jgi:hypothetical protein
MKKARWFATIVVGLFALGCSKAPVAEQETPAPPSGTPTVAHETPGEARTPSEDRDSFQVVNVPAAELPVTKSTPPEQVVAEFLNAMKEGNEGVTAGLLSTRAREETGRHGLAVQPPGSPSAKYQVTQAEISAEEPTFAQVGCLWVETDESGAEHSEHVIWVLRQQDDGWRVCGMAAEVPTRREPVFFDFEDPEEMSRLDGEIAAEMAALANGSQREFDPMSEMLEARNPGTENSLRK